MSSNQSPKSPAAGLALPIDANNTAHTTKKSKKSLKGTKKAKKVTAVEALIAQRKEDNRIAQQRLRARKAQWELLPQAFRSLFDPSPNIQSRLQKAVYVSRTGSSAKFSWKSGTPKLIPIKECVAQEPITSNKLWSDFLGHSNSNRSVNILVNEDDGTQSKQQRKWKHLLLELLREHGRPKGDAREFCLIIDIPVTEGLTSLKLPDRFGRTIVTPELTSIITANIGLSDEIVSFHIDTGFAGLSALAGECEKIWLVAPPTKENLAILQRDNATFLILAAKLNKITLIHQTATDVLFIPPGTIHATFTVKTGILYGNNFRTRENFFGATMGLINTIREGQLKSQEAYKIIIRSWLEVLKAIAAHPNEKLVGEVVYALTVEEMITLRRDGAFGDDLEPVVDEHFAEASLGALEAGSSSDTDSQDQSNSENGETPAT